MSTNNQEGQVTVKVLSIDDKFLIEEYKTFREEIKATKTRIFQMASIGVAGMPSLYSFVESKKDLMVFRATLPILLSTFLLLFLSDNRNLMRCGRYIKECIEPAIEKNPPHEGWEKWLQIDDNQGKRVVDKLVVISFSIVFFLYYIASSVLSYNACCELQWFSSPLRGMLAGGYTFIGLGFIVFLFYYYKYITSTDMPSSK